MTATGKRISKEGMVECRKLAEYARNAPVMTVRSDMPTFAERAQQDLQRAVNRHAVAAGLPAQVDGDDWNYGVNIETGEFYR